MKKQLIFFLILIFFYSCKSPKEESLETKEDLKSQALASCYKMEGNAGIIAFQIEHAANPITGKLIYSLSGKDRNEGSFSGLLKGDKLTGTYTFHSEGVESTRESIFLLKDEKLIEGFGEIEIKGNAAKFKDPESLTFDGSITLTATDCELLAASCSVDFGKIKSSLTGDCIEPSKLEIKLNPLKDGAITQGSPVYILFNGDKSQAEIFFVSTMTTEVIKKTNEGNWAGGDYKLISWKGYVLQRNGIAVFGG